MPRRVKKIPRSTWDRYAAVVDAALEGVVSGPWRFVVGSGVVFLIALLAALGLFAGATGTVPGASGPVPVAPLSAITTDQRDIDLSRDKKTGSVTEIRAAAPAKAGTAAQAPLMNWESRDTREGRVTVWCMSGADTEAAGVLREILNQLAGRFPTDGSRAGIRWREDCKKATYRLDNTAQVHCGVGDNAVACASPESYCGTTKYGDAWCGGHLSYNGNYRDYTITGGARGSAPGLDRQGLVVALSHEVQHLLLNLGHNGCGRIVDPDTGQRVASVMTPLLLPSGPSCSEPAAKGLEPADWTQALGYYALGAPSPPLTPTPTPTPRPSKPRLLGAQTWFDTRIVAGPCPNPPSGEWCVNTTTLIPIPDTPEARIPLVIVEPDDSFSYPYDFPKVGP